MTKIKLPGVSFYRDRHGGLRWRYRLKGVTSSLKGQPGTCDFMDSYKAAVDGHAKPDGVGAERTGIGTVNWILVKYYKSPEWNNYSQATKNTRTLILDKFRKAHGDKQFALMTASHVRTLLDQKQATPNAANDLLKALRSVAKFAVERDLVKTDVVREVRRLKVTVKGHRAWTEAEVSAFEAAHPHGTRARLAFALLLHTGQRRGDVVRMGPQHIRNGRVQLVQDKTGQEVDFNAPTVLLDEIRLAGVKDLVFLTVQGGGPFTPAGFGNWFRECVKEAGLSGVSAHGLRKTMARRLAEAGVSAHRIGAITGHQTLAEVERYTRSANRAQMGDEAILALYGEGNNEQPENKKWLTSNSVSQIGVQPTERKGENV
jgi:integrase